MIEVFVQRDVGDQLRGGITASMTRGDAGANSGGRSGPVCGGTSGARSYASISLLSDPHFKGLLGDADAFVKVRIGADLIRKDSTVSLTGRLAKR